MGCDFPTDKKVLCPPYSLDEVNNITGDLLPNGKVWVEKFDVSSRLYAFMKAKNNQLLHLFNTTLLICEDFDPAFTVFLLDRWEQLLGLPDDCLPIGTTIDERRFIVLLKLTSLNVVNEQDYIELAACLGFDIEIAYPPFSLEQFPYTFPFLLGGGENDLFTVIIKLISTTPIQGFAYTFPFLFGVSQDFNIIICLFNKLKPAYILFKYEIDSPPPPITSTANIIQLDDGSILSLDDNTILTDDN